jgi:hypothetical protein
VVAECGPESHGAPGTNADEIPIPRIAPLFQANNTPAQLYGEPIDFRGLRHAPINEQGVVYLLGMVSCELGFYIEAIQQGFPHCEGKYLHHARKNLWAKARIEFDIRAASFRQHGTMPANVISSCAGSMTGQTARFARSSYRVDLLVERAVIVELKAVDRIAPIHEAQLLSYLRLSKRQLGLLINFNVVHLKEGIKRMVNNL